MFLRGQPRPHLKGRGPASPTLLGPTCAHTVSETTTKFGVVGKIFTGSITNADAQSPQTVYCVLLL